MARRVFKQRLLFTDTIGGMNRDTLRRLGLVGFLFFLLKGLAWLLLPLVFYSWWR